MARIPDEVIDQIREGLPIEEVIGEFVQLRRAGSAFKGLCPFHEEKTPSFNVNPRMGIFKCFGCGAGGNVIQFLMRHEGMSFREALHSLAKRQGIDLTRYEEEDGGGAPSSREKVLAINRFAAGFYRDALHSSQGRRALAYLRDRKVSDEAREAFRVGCAPASWDALCRAGGRKGISPEDLVEAGLAVRREGGTGVYDRFRDRVMFPILGPEGDVAAFGGRSLPDSESHHATAKYVNSPDTPVFRKGRVLFGLHQAREVIRAEGRALVTEGYFDVVSLWQAGFRGAVAPLGTALTAEHIRALRAHAEQIVFVFDPDRAGRAASERAGEVAGRLLELAGTPDLLVAGDVLRKHFIDRQGLGSVRLRVVELPGGKDVDELLREEGGESFGRLLDRAEGLLDRTVRAALGEVGPGADQAEKVAAVRRLLPVLAASHPSVREQYYSLLEDQLGVSFSNIASMVDRMLAEGEKASDSRAAGPAELLGRPSGRPRVEMDALRAILSRLELASRPEVFPDAFGDAVVREIVGRIRDAEAQGRPFGPSSLVERLESPAAIALVTELAAEPLDPEEAEEEFLECMARLQERFRRRREAELVRELEEARRREGEDSPAVRRLLEQKNALLRERQRSLTPR